jgi:Raf kinase inhibitor-like YbhB/YbcL family protein
MFTIKSNAFQNEDRIPTRYTCEGEGISPDLHWENQPVGTKSFVLIVFDPDAPRGGFTHWLLYDIPADVQSLAENLPLKETLPGIGINGLTDYKRCGYGSPCPPKGSHRYYFTIYALDNTLNLPAKKSLSEIKSVMDGHILAQAEIMGHYEKQQK